MKPTASDYAALILRIALGGMFVAHGLLKFLVFSLSGTAGFFESAGFPGWTAYVVAPAEVALGAALIAGLHTRWAALAGMPVLLGAFTVHAGNGWVFSSPHGGWEYPLFLILIAAAVALQGGGRIAVAKPAA